MSWKEEKFFNLPSKVNLRENMTKEKKQSTASSSIPMRKALRTWLGQNFSPVITIICLTKADRTQKVIQYVIVRDKVADFRNSKAATKVTR